MLQVFRLRTAQRKSSEEIYFPACALNKGLDFLFIPIVCFVIIVKTYELFDLNLFIIAVAPRDLAHSSIFINKGANALLWLMLASNARHVE